MKNKYDRHEPTATFESQAPEFGQAYKECDWVKHVSELSTWESGLTVQHNYNLNYNNQFKKAKLISWI